jgi:hypothetical protein
MTFEHSNVNERYENGGRAKTGRCMCGDIRYEISGPIFDVIHCHCESCRRHASAPFATFFNVDKPNFRYTRGTPVLYQSSADVVRSHCGRCGSPISFENPREFALYACTLEDLTLVKPQAHVLVGEMLPWLDFGDDLPCFAKGLHGDAPIGNGPANLQKVSDESVRTNSWQTNAARDQFDSGRDA